MFSKKESELELIVKKVQQKIKSALTLGLGNQADTLQRTSGWSGDAVEHSRMQVVYKKDQKGFKKNLFPFKKKHHHKKDPSLDYASYGAQGLIARAGNCQEYVGLAAYYLFQNNPKLKIQFLELDDCFDHVLLKVSTEKEKLIYDPWMGLFYKEDSKQMPSELKTTAGKIIEGLKYEMNTSDDKAEKEEIRDMIDQCNAKLKKPNLKLRLSATLSEKDFPDYKKVFDETYKKELQEMYPRNPHLK